MSIRGWVYVLSNRAMPGLVKIGFSTKDPILRVNELNGSGLPHAFDIEYDVLTTAPRETEQDVHRRLAAHREAKEFFRIRPTAAIQTIRESIQESGKTIISENPGRTAVSGQASEATDKTQTRLSQKQNTAAKQSDKNACPVCKTTVSGRDSRCPKCFAFLS